MAKRLYSVDIIDLVTQHFDCLVRREGWRNAIW